MQGGGGIPETPACVPHDEKPGRKVDETSTGSVHYVRNFVFRDQFGSFWSQGVDP
jgi:hypothetical protein